MTEIASPEPTHANSAGAATNGNGDGGNAHAPAHAHNNNELHRPPLPQKDTSSYGIDLIDIDTISISSHKSDELSSLSEDVFSGDSFELDAEAQTPARAAEAAPPSHKSLPPNVNGHARDRPRDVDPDSSAMDDEPPAKRRRVRDTTPASPARRPKPISPPWKKIEAEGPSSFTEGGRRKSGRINTLPLELQHGDKRITRRALHGQQASPPRNRYASTNGHSPTSNSTPSTNAPSKRPASSTKPMPSKAPASTSAPRASARKAVAQDTKSSTRSRRRSASPPRRPATPTKAPLGTRRSTRRVKDAVEDTATTSPGTTRTTPRIVLKPRPPLTTIPLVHREQANIRPKLGPSFEEYFERGLYIPVSEGGLLLEQEDGPEITDEIARHDAQIILRVEKEVEEGGILAPDRCSLFQPEPEEEPPRQWAHLDHLTKAMSNFRKLLLMEQQRHRAAAKRLAIACEAEWRRRNPQPQTAEEIEFEQMERSKARWRQVNKAITGTWENVRVEINRRRLVEWEVEEQRRVKAALNQAVNLSEQKLQARQARLDTEDITDESDMDDMGSNLGDDEGTDDEDGDEASSAVSAEDESNMSSSDDDEDKNSVRSDEGLTQDQLRAKYADLPGIANEEEDNAAPGDKDTNDMVNGDDTSDESVDMDDDLGSTEDESAGDEEEGEEEDSDASESEDEPAGLLGLFFKKSELKQLKQEVASEKAEPEGKDVEMVDADESVESKPLLNGHVQTNGTIEPTGPPAGGEVCSESLPGVSANHAATTNGTSLLSGESTPANATEPQAQSTAPVFTDGSAPLAIPVPQSVSAAAPEPTASVPAAVAQTTYDPVEPADDILMANASPVEDSFRSEIPQVQITEASANPQHSPDTDAITTLPSPSRSQSPRTSDTKPSDVETPTSGSLLNVPKTDSRSTSPQPAVPKTEIPFLLRGTLREYQHHGLDWLATLYRNKTNGILADEMGLGKTIQTIALLAHLACQHEVWGPHLVIVPTSVMLNWEMEFKKWCPGFKILTYYGNQEERKRKRQGWTNDDVWNVCITSYQMVLQDQQVFRRRRWHYMILDEAHNIKNFKSQRWQTLLGFNTHSRLLLTGTPLQNNLTELWSLLYFLAPPENGEGGFVDLREFHNWFSRPESQILESGREQLDDEARAIISKLHKVLRPYLLRRLKADVEKQMPAKYEHVEFCRLSKRQRELYDGFLSRNDTRETLESGNYMSIINCLMQLRKVCNHPDLFVDRPIMTSFRMQRSVPADYDIKELVIRKRLLAEKPMSTVSLSFLNMLPVQYEGMSNTDADQIIKLSSHRILLDLREAQKVRANNAYTALDPSSVKSSLVYLESAARWSRYTELQHCVYLNALRRQQRPIYGKGLVNLLTLDTARRPFKQRPKVPQKIMSWFEEDSFLLHNAIPTLQQRAGSMETTIAKFACVTPAVVTGDMHKFLLGERGIEAFEETDLRLSAPVKYAPYMPKEPPLDPWHEARMRTTIQFPDKRLLQYDCGKLQVLDKLLRKLQAGNHRALIFTQMTKVLDILEQFLNIHGHKYLRLDGSTKVEQRQILTDRFNHDPRILVFILSSRSGGLGINLTGADTVIFYDQDWNPAMDKQCQDRCHRIGQTRDVHIYRLVSEHTIEANILRKASQKQMLDDVVIQEGEFTTDYFNKISVRDVINSTGEISANENDVVANAAMDRILGGVENSNPRVVGRVLEQAEDTEDAAAARLAEKEIQQDDADFLEQQPTPGDGSGASSVRQGTPRDGEAIDLLGGGKTGPSGLGLFAESAADIDAVAEVAEVEYNAFGTQMHTIDDYMLQSMAAALEGTPLELPRDKKRSRKKGKDTRKR
ncbi:SNF2 family N-terminal domain-containing protein [Cercophora scortea]|uniref:DNA helicase n=1 Tax=Cercophora scortea TaxID=314031 RepID=A0AAE0M6Q7_9PEZI|nr:SNF2 family N-terminal domain-containing protein [Cercophora scortea]